MNNNTLMNALIPNVVESTAKGDRGWDLMSRLLQDRIIFLSDEINDASAAVVVAELLYLESVDPDKPINLYVNSPGGSVTAGGAIIDTMNLVKCPVCTIGLGMCASMGAVILSSGTKGMRYVLPSCEVMIHQPLTQGISGPASDILIRADLLRRTRERLNGILAANTGRSTEEIERATDRDNFMTASEAVEFGLADKIIESH